MKTKTAKRILAALVTIPIAISLTGCCGAATKKSEPKKPAVTSSQSVKTKKAKEKEKTDAQAKDAETKAQAPAEPAPQQAQKPAAPARRTPQQPARQYQAPAKPAYQKPATNSGNTGGGYQPKPYETYFDKNDLDNDGNVTGGGDEFGNTW